MNKTYNKDHYTYSAIWSENDAGYLGLCKEFPTLCSWSEDIDEAFRGIRDVVGTVIEDMQANNESISEPQGVNAK